MEDCLPGVRRPGESDKDRTERMTPSDRWQVKVTLYGRTVIVVQGSGVREDEQVDERAKVFVTEAVVKQWRKASAMTVLKMQRLLTGVDTDKRIAEAFRRGELVVLLSQAGAGLGKSESSGGGQGSGGSGGSGQQNQQKQPPKKPQKDPEPPPKEEKTWIRVILLDEDGIPMKNEKYSLGLPDGSNRAGKLDADGAVYIPPSLPPDKECTINFPEIHLNPRKKKR